VLGWVLGLVGVAMGVVAAVGIVLGLGNDRIHQWVVAVIAAFFSSMFITQIAKVMMV
jgi:hypothetical protein